MFINIIQITKCLLYSILKSSSTNKVLHLQGVTLKKSYPSKVSQLQKVALKLAIAIISKTNYYYLQTLSKNLYA